MIDQADRLRQVIDNLRQKQALNQTNLVNSLKRNARVLTVTSGKGGVGKTNIAINLAISLSEMGRRVVVIDADFGLANIDVLFGMIPQYTLLDVVQDRKNILEVLAEGPKNVKFVSGGSGVEELVKLNNGQIQRFVNNIGLLDRIADFIIIDTGAGLSDTVMSFVMAADEVLLVTTPEPTSMTDAYALIKMVSNRDREKVIKVVVNRAENITEANDIQNRLQLVAEKFLKIKLYSLGYLLQDDAVSKAVKIQQPFLVSYPKSQVSRCIKDISQKLIDIPADNQKGSGIRGFMNRLVNIMSS
jgi:flagellar biosynthesis protein FlhG